MKTCLCLVSHRAATYPCHRRPYIQTQCAYYILQQPAIDYAVAYRTFWSIHRLTQLLFLTSVEESYNGFVEALVNDTLQSDGIVRTADILGRRFCENDLRFCVCSLLHKNRHLKKFNSGTK